MAALDFGTLVGSSSMTGTAAKKNNNAVFDPGQTNLPGQQGGTELAYRPNQGPVQGGPETPGTPNSSPSTLSMAQQGLIKAVQDLSGPDASWASQSAPQGMPNLGSRLDPPDTAERVLGKLVRGVY